MGIHNAAEVKLVCHSINVHASYAQKDLDNEQHKLNNTEKCNFLTSFEINVPIQIEFQNLNLSRMFS